MANKSNRGSLEAAPTYAELGIHVVPTASGEVIISAIPIGGPSQTRYTSKANAQDLPAEVLRAISQVLPKQWITPGGRKC